MIAEFLDYLVERNKWDSETSDTLRDAVRKSGASTYEYLKKNGQTYGIGADLLQTFVLDYCKQAGRNLCVVDDLKSMKLAVELYKPIGGFSKANAEKVIPLTDGDTYIVLTTCPDNNVMLGKVDATLSGRKHSYGVCTDVLWGLATSLYVDPILVAQLAEQIGGSSEQQSSAIAEIRYKSDARNLVNQLIGAGLQNRASDGHLMPTSTGCKVIFRIDGKHKYYTTIPMGVQRRVVALMKESAQIGATQPYEPIDGKLRFSPEMGIEDGGKTYKDSVDIRISILATNSGDDVNFRYLSSSIVPLDKIGMSKYSRGRFLSLLKRPNGVVIQTGPVGSGKSTTLYSGIDILRNQAKNIITIEDPVEKALDGITQVDVREAQGLTFEKVLKACLRHDPDVVVVGELRDKGTALTAMRAANTGRLILTTLHTNDSIGAIERLVNLGVEPYSIGEVLTAVMSQRLVRKLCPYCREKYTLDVASPIAKKYYLDKIVSGDKLELYRAVGCVHCNNEGYYGRTAINEILEIDSNIRKAVQSHATRAVYEDYLLKRKFKTMYLEGIDKVLDGTTSLEEMEEFALDTIAFKGVDFNGNAKR